MPSDELQRKVARVSAVIYGAVSAVMALAFFVVSRLLGYNSVARYGGTVWVFLLSMIITMPTITPLVKRRFRE